MFCTQCGVELEPQDRYCCQCGKTTGVGSPFPPRQPARQLTLSTRDKKIAGVCAGFAQYFDVDVTLMRIIWLVLVFVAAGFDAIEIRMSEEVSLDSTPDQMKQLADDAHKAGVMIASMWVSRPLSQHPINSPDPAVRAQGVAALEKSIELAKYANCAALL